MHEIKFRGKRVDNSEWAYGALVKNDFLCLIIDSSDMTHLANFIDVIPETVGQFTGLHDRTGREIYEGDIVVKEGYKWFDDGEPNYRGTVEWIYSQWQVIANCVNPNKRGISDGINEGLNDEGYEEGEHSDWEVIGNIYENPELLKGGE